ncbi:MAG: PAS domain S-box protein [Acidobacteriota bacterium]
MMAKSTKLAALSSALTIVPVLADIKKAQLFIFLIGSFVAILILGVVTLLYRINKKRTMAEEEARHIKEKIRLEEGLRESKERYRNMIENSNDAVWVLDRDGRFQLVNNSFQEITGYRKKEIMGKSFKSIILGESIPLYEKALTDAIRGRAETVEVKILHKYLKKLTLSVNVSSILSSGAISGTVSFARDITLKKSLEQELIKKNKELSALREIASTANHSLDVTTLSRQILRIIVDSLKMDGGAIFLLDRENDKFLRPLCILGINDESTFLDSLKGFKLGEGLVGTIALIEEPMTVEDITSETKLSGPEVLKENFRGVAGAPIKFKGRVIGVLTILSRKAFLLPEKEVEFFTLLTDEVGLILSNVLLFNEILKKSRRLETMREIDRAILSSMSKERVLDEIVVNIRKAVPCKRISISRYYPERKEFVLLAVSLDGETKIGPGNRIKSGQTLLDEIVRTGRSICIDDLNSVDHPTAKQFLEEGIKSSLLIPLKTKNEIIGTLDFGSSMVNGFAGEPILIAEELANQVAVAISNAELFEGIMKSRREWQNTFDSILDPICIHGSDGSILKVNWAFARKVNSIPSELIGKMCHEVFGGMDPSFPFYTEMNRLIHENPRIAEIEIKKFNGIFEVATVPLLDLQQHPIGMIHIFRDVTESKRLREDLIQSEKLSALGQLVAGIAHEMNNPLSSIIGYTQLLLSKEDNEHHRGYAEKVLRESERAARIVQNLLTFARKSKPEKKVVNINEIIERMIDLHPFNLTTGSIKIVKNLKPDLPKVMVDAQQMQQVFLNILINAEQAMMSHRKEGSITICSDIVIAGERKKVKIDFKDEGCGIPEKFLSRIFDPFFTTKDAGKGTGLGLSVSLGIVREHGGTICARNYENGAIVSIELPAITEEELPADVSYVSSYFHRCSNSSSGRSAENEMIKNR